MGVLHRPAVPGEAGPESLRTAVEADADKPRMAEHRLHLCHEGPQRQPVAGGQGWRGRAVFGQGVVIALAEDHGREPVDPVQPAPARQADLDGLSGGCVNA